MNEKLLQFLWRLQYYRREDLRTTEGERLLVIRQGTLNTHQGPDFLEATVQIGHTRWAGNIELHIRSSDWDRHGHSADVRYNNIILHVVWEDDRPLRDGQGNFVPTLEMKPLVPKLLIEKYRQMMETMVAVPCLAFLPALSDLGWVAWKERLAVERLVRRNSHISAMLTATNYHWEEVCWRMLAANFGLKVNAVLFEQVAQSLPITVCARHRDRIQQLEALLMGQANLLGGKYTDGYPLMLQREYRYLRKKYNLPLLSKQPAFLRMRPAAFPTIRLAQLAMLLYRNSGLFELIRGMQEVEPLISLFTVTANDYWHYHYRFDEETPFQPKQLGREMAQNIITNTVVPLLFAYGMHRNEPLYRETALRLLGQLSPEKNQLTNGWIRCGVGAQTALDSQALIELTNHYCAERRCLDCAVGNKILKNDV